VLSEELEDFETLLLLKSREADKLFNDPLIIDILFALAFGLDGLVNLDESVFLFLTYNKYNIIL
jgi:hypothetical protein